MGESLGSLSSDRITLLSSRKNSPSLDVGEHEVLFNHMRDTVENLSQLKDNELEEVFSGENFDDDKTVYDSQSGADKDKNCTALKKVSLSVHSEGSNDVVDKYGSEVFSVSHPIGLPNSEIKYYMNAVAGTINQMDIKFSGVGNQFISGVGSKNDIVENRPIEKELMHDDLMNLIKS
eukprot:7469054-Ditylum_brightwellii.AAC.1